MASHLAKVTRHLPKVTRHLPNALRDRTNAVGDRVIAMKHLMNAMDRLKLDMDHDNDAVSDLTNMVLNLVNEVSARNDPLRRRGPTAHLA